MSVNKINKLLKAALEKASPGITECKTDEEPEQYFANLNYKAALKLTKPITVPINNNQTFIIPLLNVRAK
jgi:hypothetical protein